MVSVFVLSTLPFSWTRDKLRVKAPGALLCCVGDQAEREWPVSLHTVDCLQRCVHMCKVYLYNRNVEPERHASSLVKITPVHVVFDLLAGRCLQRLALEVVLVE
jgi:hypothetical protein